MPNGRDEEQEDDGSDIRQDIDTHGHWLDYKIEHVFSNAAPPPRLVRFIPLEQYLSILTTRELYIPRATEYEDPYDCAFPGSLSDAIREALVRECDEPEFALPSHVDRTSYLEDAEELLGNELDDLFADEIPERWFVSCWHAGDGPTDLMWRSYGGHKGVCVSCDGPALLQQLQDTLWVKRNFLQTGRGQENFKFFYGHVDYERPVFEVEQDDEEGPIVNFRYPAFHKNRFFRLDQEFRFAAKLITKETAFYSAGAKLDLTVCDASVSTSPLCPRWIAKSVEAVTRQFYPDIRFDQLSLETE